MQRVETWLDEALHQGLRGAVSQQAESESSLPPLLGAGPSGEAAATPKSAQEAWALLRKASVMLRADAQWADAGRAVLRAARWASVAELPPHQAGLTRFAAPRKEARAYLENLHSTAQTPAQWDSLLDECSRMFNEGSNHLWLDLLAWSNAAYLQLGPARELAQAQLALDLRGLLARLPQLPTLKFDDGQAFASTATLEWISQVLQPASAAAGPAAKRGEPPTDSDTQAHFGHRQGRLQGSGPGAGLEPHERTSASLRLATRTL